MILLAFLALLCLSETATAGLNTSCQQGNGTQPTPASTQNFNCLRLYENWRTSATIDGSDTRAAGFKWYTHNGSTQTPPGTANAGGWNFGNIQPTPLTDWSWAQGQLTFNPVSGGPYVGLPLQFMTCAQVGTTQSLVGTPFGPSYYLSVDHTNAIGTISGGIWPIAWNVPTLMWNGGVGAHWEVFEPDIFEDFAPSVNRANHGWVGTGSTVTSNLVYNVDQSNPGVYAMMVVPAALNDGTTSLIKRYFNGVEDAASACSVTAAGSPVCNGSSTGQAAGTFNSLNQMQYCLALGGGVGQPLVAGEVQIWTK
jgi:hypothetical protein